jgi:uncharacterized membrane protein YhaH (DUF805 family)
MVVIGMGMFVVPILLANRDKTLHRGQYLIRAIGILLVAVVLVGVTTPLLGPASMFGAVLGVPIVVLTTLWSVHRTQDIGWSKWWCLLFLIPFLGMLYGLAMLVWPGRAAHLAESAELD